MLETDLQSESREGALAFELTVENHGDDAVDLSFSDAQRIRISVFPADAGDDADPVWRSDADQMFAQVLGTETVSAGGSVSFAAAWKKPEPGEYRVVGEVTSRDREVRAEETVLV